MFDQEILGIRMELHKLPTIEENFTSLAKSIEILEMQAEKQQLLLKYVENTSKEKSAMSEGIIGFRGQGSTMTKMMEEGSTPIKEIGSERRSKKIEIKDNPSDGSKFKKVEMPVDPDSWLFRADWYFEIHKPDSEKMMWQSLALIEQR